MKQLLTILLAASVILLAGCNSPNLKYTSDYAQGSLTGRELFNQRAMDLAEKQAETPIIDFKLSHSAAAAIAASEPEKDAEGNPIPAISFVYNPRVASPIYTEAPFWKLVPSGDSIIYGGLGGLALWSNHDLQSQRLGYANQVQLREIDSRDALTSNLIDLFPPLAPTE